MSEERLDAAAIEPLLASRWSPLAFDPDRDVSPDTLSRLFEAARWAPSCFNEQPWRFLVCRRSTDEAAWRRALDCLVDGNQAWARHAPVLIAVLCNTSFERGGDNRWAPYDTGAAAISLCLQAQAEGLYTHQMGGFHIDRVLAGFSVPEGVTPMAMMALGYLDDASALDEKQQVKQAQPRSRRPATELVFSGSWGTAHTG
jgi:nitroreductase